MKLYIFIQLFFISINLLFTVDSISCYNNRRLLVDVDNILDYNILDYNILDKKNYINMTSTYQSMTKEELVDYNPLSEKLKGEK